jgi:hypothetical protein
MPLAASADNIRYNGTGRCYLGAVGGASFDELGDLENLNFNMSVSTEKLKTNRNAAKATILEVESERDAGISFGLREMTNENLKMALLGSAINTLNQSASYINAVTPTFADDLYIDLGYLNLFSTKLTGAITGALAIGDVLTGKTSAATAKIAYKAAGFVEVVNLAGTFQAGEQVYKTVDVAYITPTRIETLEAAAVTDTTGATRRVAGTDYSLDPDYGYLRKLSSGSIVAGDKVSADYEAVNKKYIWAMSAGSVTKKVIFVSDKDDQGIRTRWTFHKIQINLDGDFPLIGSGAAILSVKGTVLADTSQASGQEYYKVETIG